MFATDTAVYLVSKGADAIDFLDDATFVLTSEAGSHRPGTIDIIRCALSREHGKSMKNRCWNAVTILGRRSA